MRHSWKLAALAVLLAGCVSGVTLEYNTMMVPNIKTATGINIALAVHDQRPLVLEGKWAENVVGKNRDYYGIPFPMHTASGGPLAEDLAEALERALEHKDHRVDTVRALPTATHDEALARLRESAADKYVLLTIGNWKSETYIKTRVVYDLTVEVYDKDGNRLVRIQKEGYDTLGGSLLHPIRHAKRSIPPFSERLFEAMFNEKQVIAALGE